MSLAELSSECDFAGGNSATEVVEQLSRCQGREQVKVEVEVKDKYPHPPPTGGNKDSVSSSVRGVAMPCKYSIERPFSSIVI